MARRVLVVILGGPYKVLIRPPKGNYLGARV